MTISATTPEVSYAGDNTTVAFPIPFVFDTAADLKVLSTDTDGNVAVITTGFTVSGGNRSTGTLTFGMAPAAGITITILDDPEREQATDYVSNDPFPAESHEHALDRGVRISKRLHQMILRCLRTQDGDPASGAAMVFPTVASRRGRFALWSDDSTAKLEPAVGLPVGEPLSQSIIGSLLYPQTAAESSAGVTPTNYAYPELDARRYGLSEADATGTNNHTAITRAISVAAARFGGDVLIPKGEYKINGQIQLYNGVFLQGAGGGWASNVAQPTLRYVGSTYQDFIVNADSNQRENYGLRDLAIYGGEFEQGRARWVVRFSEFHRLCEVTRCRIRDGVGIIRIDSGYYGSCHHNILQRVTPSQAAGGISASEWNQVYSGTGSAPIYLGEMNGADCSHNIIDHAVGEHSDGNKPSQAALVWGTPVDCRHWTVEVVGVDHTTESTTYSPRMDFAIHNIGNADFSGIYVEDVDVDNYFFYATGEAKTLVEKFFIYRTAGNTVFYNDAMGDMVVDDGYVYRADYARAWYAVSSGIAAGGDIHVGENVHWRSGERLTDAGVNADSGNVFDTDGTNNPSGAANGTINRFHAQRTCFPRVVTGLTVTDSSDGSGAYIQITGGVFLSERGKYVNTKFRTNAFPSSVNQSVQRLRPTTVSRYYRVMVGRAGNIFLIDAAVAFTDPTGDWLASFDTDSGGAIQNLAANGRLSIRGHYTTGTNFAISYGSAAPNSGLWARGDTVLNTAPSGGGAPGWVCTNATGPEFKAMASLVA